MFSQYWWPGNVRQLKNEIQRAVALSAPGGTITLDHLSPELAHADDEPTSAPLPIRRNASRGVTLARAVEQVERDLIRSSLTAPKATSPKLREAWACHAAALPETETSWARLGADVYKVVS